MNDYPGNSHKSKDEKSTKPTGEKKIQKRVSKPAKTKKKGELRKFAEEKERKVWIKHKKPSAYRSCRFS